MLVMQRTNYDCALAVLAMVAGKPYEALFDQEFCERVEAAKTCSGDNLDEAYRRAGFVKGESMWVFSPGINPNYQFVRNLLRGRRAMIQVPSLNYEGAEHFIYWDGRAIHDPSNKQRYQYMQQVFPTYVTMFDEQHDGDPHGECAEEIANLRHLLGLCYAKMLKFGVENSDPLLMDELKLELTK